ncbi:mobilization protein [Janthinobacterium sp. ROICE36]|uniref:mobilization protein n=1 Tax=Janthinobacterium sp. ROICE36 TaxID=2048670 RepID=UPI000C7F005A|nr:mobilization protein [Janthinobacterium sp. ROICE36]PLY39358.1 mobilization protein [Janthinobacterium sp. ROICE36]
MTPIEERIKTQEEKLKQLKALKQKQEAALRAEQAKKDRAAETRRKILAGALVLEIMAGDEETKLRFISRLDKFLTRPDDRRLFGLASDEKTTQETE